MPQFNEANPTYLGPFVCVDCRRSFKRPQQKGVTHRPCPLCNQPAVQVSQKFKPPRDADIQQWDKVRLLLEHGFRFHSIRDRDGCEIAYPANLREAKEWVVKFAVYRVA